jgi:hypothetical protein
VRNPKDGYYYALAAANRHRAQKQGICLMRTANLAKPTAWRAWDGSSFSTRFVNPYRAAAASARNHVCEPVDRNSIANMSSSLTWSTHLDKWLLVGTSGDWDPKRRMTVHGFYYSLSDDLIHWEHRKLIREAELTWTYECGDSNPVAYPSLLDPNSRSRNFETVGKRAWLYFTRLHYADCRHTSNRDLVRVPIEFP